MHGGGVIWAMPKRKGVRTEKCEWQKHIQIYVIPITFTKIQWILLIPILIAHV